MAKVHVLRGQDRVFGFTLDRHGTNLPRQYGPWTTFKTIELHHDEPYQGVDVSVCLEDIRNENADLAAGHALKFGSPFKPDEMPIKPSGRLESLESKE